MPYGRYRSRRTFGRGRRRFTRRNGYKSRSMFRVARRVIRQYRPQEKKFLDTSISMSADSDTGGSLTLLNGMAQGVTDITRIGNRVKFLSIYMRLKIHVDAVAISGATIGAATMTARLALVLDRQPNGVQASITAAGTGIYESDDPLALRDKDTGKRFHVYYDKLFSFPTNGIAYNSADTQFITVSNLKTVDKFKRFKKLMPEYNGTGATITSIGTGALYLVLLADSPTGIDIDADGEVRLRFIDA